MLQNEQSAHLGSVGLTCLGNFANANPASCSYGKDIFRAARQAAKMYYQVRSTFLQIYLQFLHGAHFSDRGLRSPRPPPPRLPLRGCSTTFPCSREPTRSHRPTWSSSSRGRPPDKVQNKSCYIHVQSVAVERGIAGDD